MLRMMASLLPTGPDVGAPGVLEPLAAGAAAVAAAPTAVAAAAAPTVVVAAAAGSDVCVPGVAEALVAGAEGAPRRRGHHGSGRARHLGLMNCVRSLGETFVMCCSLALGES